MSLLQQIKSDQLSARKAKDKFKASLLTTLLAEASRPGLDDGKRESTDAEVTAVVKKFIKNMKESLDAYYTEAVHTEMCIVNEYLPQQLEEPRLRNIIVGMIVAGHDNMGKIMKELKSDFTGQYDGKMASQLAKEELKTMGKMS